MYGKIGSETRAHSRDYNFRLVLCALLLSVTGVLVVHSATANEVTQSLVSTTVKQILGVGAGLVMMVVASLVDYHKLLKYSWILYIIVILLLIYVRFFTRAIYGAHRWIYFPLLGTIQPSEFSKPILLLFMAFVVFLMKDRISRIQSLLIFFAAASPVVALVLIEPDLSTTIVLVIMLVAMLFLADISYKWVVGVMIAMVPVLVVLLVAVYQPEQTLLHTVLEEHQVERINAYFFPDQYPRLVWQQQTSVMAIGSGGLFGKGLNTSSLESVKNGNFLSEEQSDFIFAVIGEELGFIGCVLILTVYAVLIFECFRTAKKANDVAGRVIAGGAGAILGFQMLINTGVALLLIPNTGIPLPFLSAGMSSLFSTFLLIGLVLNVGLYGRLERRVFFK
ncbi:MAG: FtsW/RodA/SpoVE family cell cycle protein [Lachnospiraceae bacterium]|nr:FtsW/RodA/SpoVE family cell cycle protein [Lachnospiraceae bacterium]MBP5254875.1 FtsW/RodA/SpoVE family cell cycle protein [Lachnospiraceae bacterium]